METLVDINTNTNPTKNLWCLGPMIPAITCVVAKILTNGTVGTVSIIFKRLFKNKKRKTKAKEGVPEVGEKRVQFKEPKSSKSPKFSTPLTSIISLATRLPIKLAEKVTHKKPYCAQRTSCRRQQELNEQNHEAFKQNSHISIQGTH